MNKYLKFSGIEAKQSDKHHVVSVVCKADEILQIAEIDRIRRSEQGEIFGFQRPKIKNHINEIKDYLNKDEAVLPNPIVLAFTKDILISKKEKNNIEIEVDVTNGPPGLVVDGQQRLTAIGEVDNKKFEVFVSILICEDEEELKRQFILINNTKPLSKSLIYELLPGVSNLPKRMSARSLASKLTNNLNYEETSSLYLDIKQHTNAQGRIRDTGIQRLIMNSLSDGACRELINEENGEELGFNLIATRGTQKVLEKFRLECEIINKVGEGRPDVSDMLKNEQIDLIINTTEGRKSIEDSAMIRRLALQQKVYYSTTIAGAQAACVALSEDKQRSVLKLQEIHQALGGVPSNA